MFATDILAGWLEYLRARIDSTGAGVLTLYAGTQPPTGGTPTGAAQASTPLATPCGTVDGATLTLAAPIEMLRTGAEPVTWARITTAAGAFVVDLTVGLVGTGAHIQLDALEGYPGGTITITSGALQF